VTTLAEIVENVRDTLTGGLPDEMNELAQDYLPTSGTMTLKYDVRAVSNGSLVSVGLATFYVVSVTSASKTLSVVPYGAFTASTILAGEPVRVKPRYTDGAIFRAVKADILDVCSPQNGVFAVTTYSTTTNVLSQSYVLPSPTYDDTIRVLAVRWEDSGLPDRWSTVRAFTAQRGLSNRIKVNEPIPADATIEFVLARPFVAPVSLDDNFATVCRGNDTIAEIVTLGAAARLLSGTEARRNQTFSEGDSRRSEEVPAGANLGTSRDLFAQRQRRINAYCTLLQSTYPYQVR
jgi:hypothetical protein